MRQLSMIKSNIPMCALPSLAYTASIIHKNQEPA